MDKLDYGYWNMDCMEGMKRFPDKYFEVAIVDPPYGINAPNMAMGTNKSRSKNGYPAESTASRIKRSKGAGQWDNEPPGEDYFKELFRVSKNQIIWGGNYFRLLPTKCFVVWDKVQPWEAFSQVEMAWTSMTYRQNYSDIPTQVERIQRERYILRRNRLPCMSIFCRHSK